MEDSYLNNTILSKDNNNKFEIKYFYNLDSENRICFDCGGPFPNFASINNGVLICQYCAENHQKNLNYNISFIHSLNSEFDEYLLSFIKRGGNSRFKRLCNQYEVPCMSSSQNNSVKLNKYIIRLGEYHRLLLKSEIDCSEPPPTLYKENANEPINMNIIYFPEFENYRLFQGNSVINKNNNNNNNKKKNDNNNNIDESMTSKIWEGTKSTFDVVKNTTEVIYNTSKPIVSFIGNAAFSGIKYIGSSIWNYYMDNNKENNDKNKESNYIGNNTPLNNNNVNNINNNFTNNMNNNIENLNNNNNLNYNNNCYNYNNNYPNNKNYLVNSSKFTIFTINEDKPYNNINNQNQINDVRPKQMSNIIINNNIKFDNNQIPNFYEINSINNESVNNISFYLNNNNNNNSINNIPKTKNNLLNHKNIIINNNYINNKNIIESKLDLKNNSNIPNNNYPNFSSFEKNMIIDKNVPNIIGEEIYQEKAKYPIYQSINLLNENSFTPKEFENNNED